MAEQRRLRLKEQWNSYSRQVMPCNASAVQIQECRRAFYAGAQALMGVMTGGITDAPGETADEMQMMSDLHSELEEFCRQVKDGRA